MSTLNNVMTMNESTGMQSSIQNQHQNQSYQSVPSQQQQPEPEQSISLYQASMQQLSNNESQQMKKLVEQSGSQIHLLDTQKNPLAESLSGEMTMPVENDQNIISQESHDQLIAMQ
jgi:hypothetical protein